MKNQRSIQDLQTQQGEAGPSGPGALHGDASSQTGDSGRDGRSGNSGDGVNARGDHRRTGQVETPGDVARAEQAKNEHDTNRPLSNAPRDRSYADRYRRIQQDRAQTGPRSWDAHSKLLNVLATAKEGRAADMAKQVNPNGEQINALNAEARLLREIESEFQHGPFDPFHHSVPRDSRGAPTNYQRGSSPIARPVETGLIDDAYNDRAGVNDPITGTVVHDPTTDVQRAAKLAKADAAVARKNANP